MDLLRSARFRELAGIVRSRQTSKVLAQPEQPVQFDPSELAQCDFVVREAVAAAGWAPFHFARNVDDVPEPWRVRILWQQACRDLARLLPSIVTVPSKNRVPQLLSACGSMVLVSWIPADEAEDATKQKSVDEEHLAAAAALTQNLLLLLEAAGLGSYWASAGLLNQPPVRERLGVTAQEAIVAVVYVGYPLPAGAAVERLTGANRPLRSPASAWCRELGSVAP